MAVSIRPSEVLEMCDAMIRLGLQATKLERLNLIKDTLGKSQQGTNPAASSYPYIPSASTSHPNVSMISFGNYSKRDHSNDSRALITKDPGFIMTM